MSRTISMDDIRSLSVAERILLVEEIWDSIADVPECGSLTVEQINELDRRLAADDANPTAGFTWQEVKAGLRAES